MRPRRTVPAAALLVLAACGGDPGASRVEEPAGPEADAGAPEPDSLPLPPTPDGALPLPGADTGPPSERGAGEPCSEGGECASGFCVALAPGPDGSLCAEPCEESAQCRPPEECVLILNSGRDGVRVCIDPGFCRDADGDGWGTGPGCRGPDCDDGDPGTFPGAPERCDGNDNNCDGVVDDAPADAGQPCATSFAGRCAEGTTTCLAGLLICDSLAARPERCDGEDSDCDGVVDNRAGCYADGAPCIADEDCRSGSCLLGVCGVPANCAGLGTCPDVWAPVTGGAALQSERFQLTLTVGPGLASRVLRSENFTLTLGTGAWHVDPP